jgi:hypothetical protein
MGMDVYGNSPTTQNGEYFRNNVWWWRPLADYILSQHGEIATNGCSEEYWHSNSGGGLNEEGAKALAMALRHDLETGRVAEYERKYNEYLASLDREECDLCNATGIRTDAVGVEMGMPTKELSPETQILTGRTHGWCNACDGVGTKEHWAMGYPFSQDNVREFAEFLEGCGGFQIC